MPIKLNQVGHEWPNGNRILQDITLTLEQKVYGFVGSNGVGKTTLAKIILGELCATDGEVIKDDINLVYFSQTEPPPDHSVTQYLIETFIFENPDLLSLLEGIDLESLCSSLSGGEWMKVRLAKVASTKSTFLILDEPTNHLDSHGRQVVEKFINTYQGGILIISHDRQLLEKVDCIIELSNQGASQVQGGWSEYERFRHSERESLRKALEFSKKEEKKVLKKRQKEKEKQEKRQAQGKKKAPKSGNPRVLIGAMKRSAQKTAGKIQDLTNKQKQQAILNAKNAYHELKFEHEMFAKLLGSSFPHGKRLVYAKDFNFSYPNQKPLWSKALDFSVKGPEKILINGPNGSGKSTLLKVLLNCGPQGFREGTLQTGDFQAQYFDQDYSLIHSKKSLLENIQQTSQRSDADIRDQLAPFLFKGEDVFKLGEQLSGGEKMRAALAKAVLATPQPDVLFLDEPTNNLDMVNIEFLENFLGHFQGALFLVCHDRKFTERLNHKMVLKVIELEA